MSILNSNAVGPLDAYLQDIERCLLTGGYSRFSVNNRLGWTLQLSRWMASHDIESHRLSEAHLAAFIRIRRRLAPHFSRGSIDAIIQCLVELRVIGPPRPLPKIPPSKIDSLVIGFEYYLLKERMLSCPSQYSSIVKAFLQYRFGSRHPRPESIKASDLIDFILFKSRIYSVGTTKLIVTALRSYCRFLYCHNVITHDLTGAIPAIASWRLSGIPKGLETEIVSRILKSPSRRTHVGRRDYAILLLLARLGLRRKEVATLQLEDVDWERGEIFIRGKGNKCERLPLPQDVGAALSVHLRSATGVRRNPSSRAIFVGLRPPFYPLTPGGISNVVTKAAHKAGFSGVTPHRFRHTLATQTLKQGGSLDEVAQILRHSSHDTTAIYAKVDLTSLCSVIRVWPGVTS